MADTPYLYYRKNGVQKTVEGAVATSSGRDLGLSFCWRYKSGYYACAKMVRKGSAYADSDLCIRHNGIDYVVRKNNDDNTRHILDDVGLEYEHGDNVSVDATGWYFGLGISYTDAPSLVLNCQKTFTIAFKVKGSSSTGSEYPGEILALSTYGDWVIGDHPDRGDILTFGLRSNGELFFRDYYSNVAFSGTKTNWYDFKITFKPTGASSYDDKLSTYKYAFDFTAVCNGVTKTGTTYLITNSSYQDFYFALSPRGHTRWVKGESDFTRPLYGYIKYISIAQDEVGYSDYVRSTHKVALYFD